MPISNPPTPSSIKRIVFLGRKARMTQFAYELGCSPNELIRRRCMIVSDNFDLDMLRGFRPEELRYVEAGDLTPQMWEFVTSRRHERISIEEAAEWLKSNR